MATPLTSLGLEKDNRIVLLKVFNMLAKSDFWHDFGSSFMQELLNSASLTSSLSFAERGRVINTIRTSLGGNPTVQDYFMENMDQVLPHIKGATNTFRTEKKLLREINVEFDKIEGQLKAWNEGKKELTDLPNIENINPTYGTYSREYSIRALPVKSYNGNIYLPSVFKEQTKVNNYILMIDASHLSMTELGVRKLSTGELLDAIEGFNEKEVYNFYIVQSNENDSDPATKITEVEVEKGLEDIINIYFLKDEGNVSIYPVFLGSDKDEGQNENLYSKIGIQSTRTDKNTITATLTGEVNMIVEDLGEISKIEKAAQKAVDVLIENKGTITPQCLSYFLLKRAGDWCQALCLLDRTRVYSLYKQEKVELTITKQLKKGTKVTKKIVNQPVLKDKLTLQDLIDRHKQQIVVALVTFDRVLLTFALLLGLNVFFTTKYLNLNRDKPETSSIHWSLFFQNVLDAKVAEEEKGRILALGADLQKQEFNGFAKVVTEIKSKYKSISERFENIRKEVLAAVSLDTYLIKLHLYTHLQMNLITESEVDVIDGKLKEIEVKLRARNTNPPKSDPEFVQMRDELMNFNTVFEKLTTISEKNASLVSLEKYPEVDNHIKILTELFKHVKNPRGDIRRHISYNNFLEEIIKTLLDKFNTILGRKLLTSEEIQRLTPTQSFTIQFIDPSIKGTASRSQDLILKYLKDALLTGFPKIMAGGFQYKIGHTLDTFKNLLEECFFGLRNRKILALNLYKYYQLQYTYDETDILKDTLIGLKQSYITDRDGNYFSILDNYLVTDSEEQYIFDIEDEDEEVTNENQREVINFLKALSVEEKEGESKAVKAKAEGKEPELNTGKIYLSMYRYIIMRSRLYLCDKYYQIYLELISKYEEELQTLIESNPTQSDKIQKNDREYISATLQNAIGKLGRKVLLLQDEIKNDGLLSLKTKPTGSLRISDYFNTIYYWIADIRLIIFSYSKRHYTPATELEFREFEAARILTTLLKVPIEELKKAFYEEVTTDSQVKNELEKLLTHTSVKNEKETKDIKAVVAKTVTIKDDVPFEEFEQLADNTIVDIHTEERSIHDKVGFLQILAEVSLAGGRRRKTRRTKKRNSKRRSRKH